MIKYELQLRNKQTKPGKGPEVGLVLSWKGVYSTGTKYNTESRTNFPGIQTQSQHSLDHL